jgi:hypothetical protein
MNPSADLPTAHIARLKVTLEYSDPVIWRRIEVPLTASLQALHEVIQAVMLFENYHLFEFVTGKRGRETRYAIPDPDGDFTETMDARKTTLGQLTEAGVTRLIYTYDFGDDWRHTILVESVVSADPALDYPRFIEGANRAPPEDVGGQPGFEHFLSVTADAAHPEHADITQWYGRTFNPKDIAEAEIAVRIRKLAKRQKPRKTAAVKTEMN